MKAIGFIVVIIVILLLAMFAASMLSLSEVITIRNELTMLPEGTVVNLGNCTWESLPLPMREYLSRNFEGTLLNRDDLGQLYIYYKKLYVEYTEPVSLKLMEGR